jgi:hypothetical protein
MEEAMNPQPTSKCHNAPVLVASSDEGTSYYVCAECGQPCDIQPNSFQNGNSSQPGVPESGETEIPQNNKDVLFSHPTEPKATGEVDEDLDALDFVSHILDSHGHNPCDMACPTIDDNAEELMALIAQQRQQAVREFAERLKKRLKLGQDDAGYYADILEREDVDAELAALDPKPQEEE